jgi:uncharacterized DUF497 family protein
MFDFDWDDGNRNHIARHNVSCEEAEQVLLNAPLELGYEWIEEERIAELGHTNSGRILVVISTWRGHKVRVVTAYDAVKVMQTQYLRTKRTTQ